MKLLSTTRARALISSLGLAVILAASSFMPAAPSLVQAAQPSELVRTVASDGGLLVSFIMRDGVILCGGWSASGPC